MSAAVSPLAVKLPELPPLPGVRLGATAAGIRYQGRTDLVMMEVPSGSTVAGVFTSNKCPGAPVDWCRAALKGGKARAVVVNAGNANVFTGEAGHDACAATAGAAAELVGCPGEAGVRRLHRRHRRGAAARQADRRAARAARLPARGRVGGRGARHHDHRHLPQGVHPHRRDRRHAGADQRHRQGQRHDRAGYGDHAVLHLHRREDSCSGDAGAAVQGRGWVVQLHHGRFGYLHLGHRAADRHRPDEARARAGGRRAGAARTSPAR